ncbi:MAG: pyrroline-5-carboxylate reductase [Solirubrobacteraceae bacterium]|jgi:pyrroline-5-carboxylate reductase|nr:pyrroline-5-carboxylate reductase [Solirubrobacteraceae bacterium]
MAIGFIGSGNMARALARGLGDPVLATDAGSGRAAALAGEVGGEALAGNAELAGRAEVIVLAHKPAQLEDVAGEIAPVARRVISLLAGVPLERLRTAYPDSEVVRAMPNTAVEVREGVTCLCSAGAPELGPAARALFERVGLAVELPERLMDAATAVSGVAPAYVALIAEAWIDSAVRHGLPAAQAAELVGAALRGSATLLQARAMDTLAVRRGVTSPAGVTARGLAALEEAGLRTAFAHAADEVLR